MDGDVKVLLVSAEGSPEALVSELSRLGVSLSKCTFAEAEENLQTNPPDLVALAGALGAIELANMIDDMEDGPRMVIVAERKELAKLRGLNREVVISLFAMETTEKVVGQRIESLARRAARRREQKVAPEPAPMKKTSLGLPSAPSTLGRVDFKKPPGVRQPASAAETPPSSGSRPGADSIPMMDDALLESLRPDEVTSEPPPSIDIPKLSSIAESEALGVSHPPTLPPVEKAQGGQKSSFEIAPGDLDTSLAESAIEGLDSNKLEITSDLVDQAQKEMIPFGERPTTIPGEVQGLGGAPTGLERTLPPKESQNLSASIEQRTSEGDPMKAVPEVDPPATTFGAPQDDDGNDGKAVTELASLDSKAEPAPTVAVEDAPLQGVRPRKSSGGAVGVLAAIVVVGGAALAYQVNVLDQKKVALDPAPRSSESARVDEDEKAEERDEASENEAVTDPEGESDAPDELSRGADEAPPVSTSDLENPFRVEDTKKPSCDVVLANNVPSPGKDPVHEASLIWEQARAAIIAGKKDRAQLFMCQAVSLNSESVAIEGLAHYYVGEGSYSEALLWVEKADSLRPGQMEMGNLRGDIYSLMGDTQKARDVWLATLKIGPEDIPRLRGVSKDYSVEAGRHLRRGDLVRADLFFRRAVILDPENLSGIIGLAKVYHRLKKPAYARAFCEMSLKVSDVIPEVHVLMGDLALQDGNQVEAKARYERALVARPDFFPAKRGLSQLNTEAPVKTE